MKIDLSKIEHEPLCFDEELLVDAERLDPDQVAGPMKVHLKGEVRRHGDFFSVAGTCTADGQLTCSRCLEPVAWNVEEEYAVEYRPAETAPAETEAGLDGEDLDVIFLDGDELDLTELAAEQVVLAMPMRIVCQPNCAGLCPRCGANLNTGVCKCEPEVDPRWGALADLADSHRES